MSIVGLSHRGRRILGTLLAVTALAALVAPSAQASGPAFKPAILDVTGWTMAGTSPSLPLVGAPLPSSGDGIGPGSYLLIDRPDGSFICTANFVWNGSGGPYLGAAGHCFLPGNVDAAPSNNPGKYVTRVQVCVSGCAFGGQLGTVLQGTFQDLGPVVFARQAVSDIEVGNDFGLVRIAPATAPLRTKVPVWGGPTSSGGVAPTLGSSVCLYGNAMGLGEVFVSKARVGLGGAAGASSASWFATLPSAPGDSGAAVVNCPGLTGRTPVGILTHLATNGTGVIAGTTVSRAISMVQAGTANNLAIAVRV